MQVTFNITPKISSCFGYMFLGAYKRDSTYLFFDFPPKIENGVVEFEMMNYGICMYYDDDAHLEKLLKERSPYFDDLINCDYQNKGIMVYGRVKFRVTNVKGVEICLSDEKGHLYYSTDYKVEKGDLWTVGGGYSPFSDHYASINVIANKDRQVSVTFSPNEYFLLDKDDDEFLDYIASKQTPYDYKTSPLYQNLDAILQHFTSKMAKMFDWDFIEEYFEMKYFQEEVVGPGGAVKDESICSILTNEQIDKLVLENEHSINSLSLTLWYTDFSKVVSLNWHDIFFAVENGYLLNKSIRQHVRMEIRKNLYHHDKVLGIVLRLDFEKEDSLTQAKELLADLVTPIPVNAREKSKDKLLYVVLNWVFKNKEFFEDPLRVVEVIYADFGFPKSMNNFVRRPSKKSIFKKPQTNIDQLYENWESFLRVNHDFYNSQIK